MARQPLGYVIVTCSYTPNSAGIGCVYRLCDLLNRRGYPSFMTGGRETAPHLRAPIIDTQTARRLCAGGYTAIYPETITGNPLEAGAVARWVLNRPGLLGGDEIYDDSELVFTYSDVFLPYVRNRVAGKLYMPTIDESLFYCDDDGDLSSRSLECFYVGKSKWKDGFFDRTSTFEITREAPAKSELGKLFRASRALYCFDNSTILIYEAAMCGCPVVIIPDGTQTKGDYEQLELGLEGISWGFEEFEGKPVKVSRVQHRYEQVKADFAVQLDRFIELTQAQASRYAASLTTPPPSVIWRSAAAAYHNCSLAARKAKNFGRSVERSFRRWRRSAICRLVNKNEASEPFTLEAVAISSKAPPLANRSLMCYALGKGSWQDGIVDRSKAVEISPSMPAQQIVNLLRATRTFYCFDATSPLIRAADACGCEVTVVGRRRRAA